MSKRIRIFTPSDVAEHNTEESIWISYKGKVLDVTSFLPDHPGGEEFILRHAGKDVEDVMKDADEHVHSESAYGMLEEFVIGRLGAGEMVVSDDWVPADDFHPDNTDEEKDFEKNQFLDLRKPLFRQMWYANFSKAYYLQQVHQPRHLPEPARLFGPDYLEVFTRASWYVIPTIWLPITAYLALRSLLQLSGFVLPLFSANPFAPFTALVSSPSGIPITSGALLSFAACFFVGNVIWTLLEYGMHRFLFHIDYYLPDKPMFLTLHFLGHGIHHYMPMDRTRLVMPPVLFTTLQAPFTRLAHTLFPASIANGIIAGSFFMYVVYDCSHYAMHHTKLPAYLRETKKYHLAHHYKNFELGFGVTSKIWDIVFNTVLPI